MNAPVRQCEKIERPEYRRSRGRSKKSWREVIRHDLKTLELVEDMTQGRRLWRYRLRFWTLDSRLSIFPLDLMDLEVTGTCVYYYLLCNLYYWNIFASDLSCR